MKRNYILAAIVVGFITFGAVHVLASPSEIAVDISAKLAAKSSQVLVLAAAGGTAITSFTNRKGVELQNLGPNPIYCTFDGQAPLSTGALGRRIDANGGTYAIDAGAGVQITCITTVNQVSGAATQVTELR